MFIIKIQACETIAKVEVCVFITNNLHTYIHLEFDNGLDRVIN